MAIYKCKNCGGELDPQENGLGKCLYCSAVQTLPKDKDDKVQNLLNRANDFRLACDFDRAIYTYEEVLKLNEIEPEAHWGLFLSRYGVEYVKDNTSYTYKPTLHRISSVSVFDDVDYKATIKYADAFAVMQYKQDAELIEAVLKELLLISSNQEPFDVFLSYKEQDDVTRRRTDDSYLAHDLYNELTAKGYKVFFAPKSLGVGLFEPKIYAAIISAKVMIVLGTKPEYFNAVWVKNEWSRFAELIKHGEEKVIVPVYNFMEAGELPNQLVAYEALNMESISFLHDLFEKVGAYVNKQQNIRFDKNNDTGEVFIERGNIALKDGEFNRAKEFFESALNYNPHNAYAYAGVFMAENNIRKLQQAINLEHSIDYNNNFKNALQYADFQFKAELIRVQEQQNEKLKQTSYNQYLMQLETEKSEEKILDLYDSISTNQYLKNNNQFISALESITQFILSKRNEIALLEKEKESINKSKDAVKYKDSTCILFRTILLIAVIVIVVVLYINSPSIIGAIIYLAIGGAIAIGLGSFLDHIIEELLYSVKNKKTRDLVEEYTTDASEIDVKISALKTEIKDKVNEFSFQKFTDTTKK